MGIMVHIPCYGQCRVCIINRSISALGRLPAPCSALFCPPRPAPLSLGLSPKSKGSGGLAALYGVLAQLIATIRWTRHSLVTRNHRARKHSTANRKP